MFNVKKASSRVSPPYQAKTHREWQNRLMDRLLLLWFRKKNPRENSFSLQHKAGAQTFKDQTVKKRNNESFSLVDVRNFTVNCRGEKVFICLNEIS